MGLLTGVPDTLPEVVALRGLFESLRDDPGLAAIRPQVTIWGDDGDPAKWPTTSPWPAADFLPLIRLTPGNYPTRWENEGQHSGRLDIQVELVCQQLWPEDRFGLWLAFYRAVFPPDTNRDALVRQRMTGGTGNLVSPELRQSGTLTVGGGADLYAQKTTAILTLLILIN